MRPPQTTPAARRPYVPVRPLSGVAVLLQANLEIGSVSVNGAEGRFTRRAQPRAQLASERPGVPLGFRRLSLSPTPAMTVTTCQQQEPARVRPDHDGDAVGADRHVNRPFQSRGRSESETVSHARAAQMFAANQGNPWD